MKAFLFGVLGTLIGATAVPIGVAAVIMWRLAPPEYDPAGGAAVGLVILISAVPAAVFGAFTGAVLGTTLGRKLSGRERSAEHSDLLS